MITASRTASGPSCTIIDLGLASRLRDQNRLKSFAGTPMYAAPEVININWFMCYLEENFLVDNKDCVKFTKFLKNKKNSMQTHGKKAKRGRN